MFQNEIQGIQQAAYKAHNNALSARNIQARLRRPEGSFFEGINIIGDRFKNKNVNKMFVYFLRLPIELQCRIWKEAMLIPTEHQRILRVKTTREGIFEINMAKEINRTMCDFVSADMGLLSATVQSKEEYLRVYEHTLPAENRSFIRFGGDDIVFWDLGVISGDRARLDSISPMFRRLDELLAMDKKGQRDKITKQDSGLQWLHQIEHLALTEVTVSGARDISLLLKKYIPLFKGLKTLTLVDLTLPKHALFAGTRDMNLVEYKREFEGFHKDLKIMWMSVLPTNKTRVKLSEGCKAVITEIMR